MGKENITIEKFDMKHLEDYYRGFDADITKYQWPDPFENTDAAKALLQEFLDEMTEGETLLYSVISEDGRFVGSVEMHGLSSDCPELGVWINKDEQKKGYAFKALTELLNIARNEFGKTAFYYEADIRNEGSNRLLDKLSDQYEIIKQGLDETTTDSGKELKLQGYVLKAK